MNQHLKELEVLLIEAGLSPEFGDGYLNIMRPDGIHCEFYPCGDGEVFCATYTVGGVETELDFWIPEDSEEFVSTVCEILEHKPRKKRGA